jgi:uncharacterized protein YhaN
MLIVLGTVLAGILVAAGGGGGLYAFANRKPDLAAKMVAQAADVVDTMGKLNAKLETALEKSEASNVKLEAALVRAEEALKRSEQREDTLTREVRALRADLAAWSREASGGS